MSDPLQQPCSYSIKTKPNPYPYPYPYPQLTKYRYTYSHVRHPATTSPEAVRHAFWELDSPFWRFIWKHESTPAERKPFRIYSGLAASTERQRIRFNTRGAITTEQRGWLWFFPAEPGRKSFQASSSIFESSTATTATTEQHIWRKSYASTLPWISPRLIATAVTATKAIHAV